MVRNQAVFLESKELLIPSGCVGVEALRQVSAYREIDNRYALDDVALQADTRLLTDRVLAEFDEVVGIGRLRCLHLNDSMTAFGSNRDRHANIGDGHLGIPFFTRMVNDPRLSRLPMILETKELTETKHREEIALLRGLVQ